METKRFDNILDEIFSMMIDRKSLRSQEYLSLVVLVLRISSFFYFEFFNTIASITGWGTTSYSGHPSDILLELLVPIWKMDDCKKSSNRRPITDKQMCAGYKQGGRDSCQVKTMHRLKIEFIIEFFKNCNNKNYSC